MHCCKLNESNVFHLYVKELVWNIGLVDTGFKLILQDLEQQQQSEADLAREKVEELESALDDEKRKREACEQQIQQHLQVKIVTCVLYISCLPLSILIIQVICIYSM